MKTTIFLIAIGTLLPLFLLLKAYSQHYYHLNSNNSDIIIKGTSSLHDWEMTSTTFWGETFLLLKNDSITKIHNILFKASVSGLKSGKSSMDRKAHNALNKNTHPTIIFSLDISPFFVYSSQLKTLKGNLTISGITREVEFFTELKSISSDMFLVSGTIPLRLSDYGISAPTALLGTLKTGDDITIHFNFEFKKSENNPSKEKLKTLTTKNQES